jgi:3-oxosteroid 1-dehydrogenase
MAKSDEGFGRRAFLKATSAAAAAGAAVLSDLAASEAVAADHWDDTADVVVLGYGGAGACAAIEAHDAGAKVLLLEKQSETIHVPNTRMAGGMWHCPNGDPTAIKQYAKALMSGENMPWKLEGEEPDLSDELSDVWASDAPGTNDFLVKCDPDFKPIRTGGPAFPTFPGARQSGYRVYSATYTDKADNSVPTRNLPKHQKMNGEAFFAALMTAVASRKIAVHFETPAKELIKDGQGRIIGALAVRNGKPFRVKARRGVVITTGGYEYSIPMRRAFLEGPGVKGWAFWGTPYNTGDGIRMGMDVGARLDKIAKCAAGLCFGAPSNYFGLMMGVGRAVIGFPRSMVVDNYGSRYSDETLQSNDPSRYFFYKEATQMDIRTLDYPRIPSWMIFDETFRLANPLATQGMGPASQGLIKWGPDNSEAIQNGWLLKGDTIEELAAKIQAHPDNRKLMKTEALVRSYTRFNDFSAKGKDEDFGRPANTLGAIEKPPFYASPMYAGGPNTKGGIAANAKRQVLDWDGKPIARLYSAGEISSAFKFVYQGGGNLTECIVFGRIAGRNAAGEKAVG